MPTRALDLIAVTMTAAFGNKWTAAHGDDFVAGAGPLWAQQLAGLSRADIARGLDVTTRDAWPPSLAEFKAACMGVLSMAVVNLERAGPASEQQPFTILVGQFIDSYAWRMDDPDQRRRRLQEAYDMAKAHVVGGGRMPEYIPPERQLQAAPCWRPVPMVMLSPGDAMRECERMLHVAQPDPPPAPPTPKEPEPCRRCNGTRRDPLPDAYHPSQSVPGECLACYGSGNESSINRVVSDDGITEDRIP